MPAVGRRDGPGGDFDEGGRPELGVDLLERLDRAYDAAPVLAMLFGREQIAKGEHEVVALAFSLHLDGRRLVLSDDVKFMELKIGI